MSSKSTPLNAIPGGDESSLSPAGSLFRPASSEEMGKTGDLLEGLEYPR